MASESPLRSALYACRASHDRYEPRRYGFKSRLFMFYLDLDELSELSRRIPIFSRNRPNVYSFYDRDHLFMGHRDLRDNVRAFLRERGVTETVWRIELLTSVRVFGYVFNPLSVFVCYDESDAPLAMIAEVHNTFGELKPYLITREQMQRNVFTDEVPKHFYISPFSDLDHHLSLKLHVPGQRLALAVGGRYEGRSQPFFHATLTGARQPLTTQRLLAFSAQFPLVTARVMGLIHWHALKLWLKGVPFRMKEKEPELQQGIYPKLGQKDAPTVKSS
ncbi:MAG: DUF1365 domain-containing protein [Verrucomicrobiota bacterium JB022]|nr:DUF1365 domain-containing protein [Verrucomicrobiota bacterium JB022]